MRSFNLDNDLFYPRGWAGAKWEVWLWGTKSDLGGLLWRTRFNFLRGDFSCCE